LRGRTLKGSKRKQKEGVANDRPSRCLDFEECVPDFCMLGWGIKERFDW